MLITFKRPRNFYVRQEIIKPFSIFMTVGQNAKIQMFIVTKIISTFEHSDKLITLIFNFMTS